MPDRGILGAVAISVLAHGVALGLWAGGSPVTEVVPRLLEARMIEQRTEPATVKPPPPTPHHAQAVPRQTAPSSVAHRDKPVEPSPRPPVVPGEVPPRTAREMAPDVAALATPASSGKAIAPASVAVAAGGATAVADASMGPAGGYAPPSFGASYLNNPKPAYPLMARRRGLQGLVRLDVKVGADGIPTAVKLRESSGHESLDEAAMTAVWHWRFAPARRGGDAVEGAVVVPVRFNLEGEQPN